MAEEIIEEAVVGGGDKPTTFADDLYNASIQSGFIPKDATFDRFKENLKNEAFVKDAFSFSLESGLIPKDATYDRFKSNLDGTNPAEKKNEKPATELPSADGSSGLLSINYGGEKYDVNPKTQEVSKGGKPVNLSPQAKDYIAKNILGVADKKPDELIGPAGSSGNAVKDIGIQGWKTGNLYEDSNYILEPKHFGGGIAGAPTTDKLATEAIQKGLTGAEGETHPSVNNDVRSVLDKNFIDVEVFDKADPAILDQAVKALSDYTGIKVDLKYPETLDTAIGQAKTLRDTAAFNSMAKEAGMTPKQAQTVANDYAANKFLSDTDMDLYRLQKQVNEAIDKGDKATVAKLQPMWEKAKKTFLDLHNDDINDLKTEIATRHTKDGALLAPYEVEQKKKDLALLHQQYNGFTKTPEQIVKELVEGDSSLSTLDKMLKDKPAIQKLQAIVNGKMARYFLLGRKMGISPKDILSEGNIRNMTVGGLEDKGLVNWSLDNIKNYMGYGDLDGKATKNDRLEFAKLHGELKAALPVLLINKSPIDATEDTSGDIYFKTASQFAPATKAQNMTGQQVASTLKDVLGQANIGDTELTADAINILDTKLKKYGFKQSLAQMGGQTTQIVAPMILSSALTGAAIESMLVNPRTATVARFLLNNPIGKIAKGAGEYSIGGRILGDSSELDLGTGATAGTVDAALDAFGNRFKLVKPWLRLMFGKKAGEAANILATNAAKGVGEFFQESGETLYQAWRDTPDGKSTLDTIKEQFGDVDDVVKFTAGTVIMGTGMGLSSDIGFNKSRLEAESRMTPEQRDKFNKIVAYFKDQDAQKQKGAVDEVVPSAKTDVLQSNLKDVTEAKDKLQKIADGVQSEDEVTPYSVTVNGVTYTGTTPAELQADIDVLQHTENAANEELYKRNTGQTEETPPTAEGDQTNVVLAKPEAGLGVEGEVEKPTPGKINVLGQEVNSYNNYVPTKAADVEPTAIYTFSATSKDGIPPLLQDKAYANKGETNGVKTENWHASISGDDLLKLFPTEQAAPSPINTANATKTVQNAQENGQNVEDKKAETKEAYVTRRKDEIFKQLKNKYPTLITGDTINPMMVQPRYMSTEEVELAQKVLDPKILELEYDAELAALNAPTTTTSTTTKNLPQGGEVKETITEKQVPETTKQIYTDTNEVGTTQYYTVNDNGNVESSIEISPVGSDIVIDNAKVSPTEKRKGLASSLVDKIIQDYKGKTNTYIDENGNEITEPYQIKLGTVVSNEGTGFAKSIQKKIDDFNAEQKQINKAPTGEVKAEPSVKAEAEKETTPPPTEAELKKKEFTAKVDDLAAKLKAKIGTDPNIQKMGLDANDVVDFIASVVKEAGKAAIDVAEAIKTAKAKLKELGVDEDLINEAEAKYTGKETKEQAIPTETIDNLLKANTRSKAINNIADTNIKEVATIVSDTNGRFKKVMDILNGDTQALTDLEEKLGFKKIC